MDISCFISGVLTTIFCAGAVAFWAKIIVPWWQDRGYDGLRLDGTWSAEIPAEDGKFIFVMEIIQKFHKIKGTLSITKTPNDGKPSQSQLEIEGTYWESFTQIKAKSILNNKLSFSVFLLKSISGGRKLSGQYVFRALNNDEILSHDILFHRAG